ncbi:MAG: helix-turn-helix domain-containing protein [Chitinophagaceae bacterium]|nr:MAG: helix-turn-helix domain-containing protein [Chitinophagaceae bacterium]
MKNLIIVIPEGEHNNLSSIVGTYKIFSRANDYWTARGNRPVFAIQLAGVSNSVQFYGGLFEVRPHTTIECVGRADFVIIPSLNHDYLSAMEQNCALTAWIEAQYKNGAEVASICTGAFLLASTGLLDGKSCSTHWSAADNFRLLFTKVNLQSDRLITDESGIYTKHLAEKITIDELSASLNVGRRNFDRRFIKATGNTPVEYTQRVKVEAAKKAFETNRKTINEVMFEVGYTDVKSFREVFRKVTGMSPLAYKEKFYRDAN